MRVIFIDGECLFCLSIVQFILKHETGVLKFSNLQGDLAKRHLPLKLRQDLDTVAFYDNGVIYTKSQAAVKILSYMKFPAKFLYWISFLLPTFLMNLGYNFFARRRLFLSQKFCLNIDSNRDKFLD